MQQSMLKTRVMRRVYIMWMLRKILHPVAMKTAFTALCLWYSTTYISYAQVFANAPTLLDVERGMRFLGAAVSHTEPMTIALLLGVTVFAAWTATDIVKRKEAYF